MSVVFLTTLAQHLEDDSKYNEREKQYMYSMARIFSYNLPVYGVISETYNDSNFKPKNFFKFEKLLDIHITDKNFTKSQKEFYSIRALLEHIELDDNTWIIKISGRYLIYNNTFMETIKNADKSVKAVLKTCDGDTQMYTFLFALRFKYFKEFFMNYNLPNNINLEKVSLFYIQNTFHDNEIRYINNLGVFCNIADCEQYTYF
jgi:hypothetical protein